jgi:TonB family protein
MKRANPRTLANLAFLFLTIAITLVVYASQGDSKKLHALLPESWARNSAIKTVMPIYPEEAVRLGISGVVHTKFETSPEGEVLRIKVKPRTDALLAKAVSDAVRQWKFKPWPRPDGLPEGVFSRLIFRFSINADQPQVELYSLEPDMRIDECLGCSNSAREMRQWRGWKEVFERRN